jgi:hypothetical protein
MILSPTVRTLKPAINFVSSRASKGSFRHAWFNTVSGASSPSPVHMGCSERAAGEKQGVE